MAQGFTVTTLLLLKQTITIADTKIRKEKPPTVDQIMTVCCFEFELFAFPWFEDGAGEGIATQLECGGVDTTIGAFAGVGASITDEGERVKKKDGDGEGESSGESEGLSDGEKGSESGDSVEGKGDGDGERVSLSSLSLFLALSTLAPFVAWRSFLVYAMSPCWPMCLSQVTSHNQQTFNIIFFLCMRL